MGTENSAAPVLDKSSEKNKALRCRVIPDASEVSIYENRGRALNESGLIDNDAGVVKAEKLILGVVGPELAGLCFDFHWRVSATRTLASEERGP